MGDTELERDDFVALATAAFLLGRTNDVVQALQRAYQAKLPGRRARRGASVTGLLMRTKPATRRG